MLLVTRGYRECTIPSLWLFIEHFYRAILCYGCGMGSFMEIHCKWQLTCMHGRSRMCTRQPQKRRTVLLQRCSSGFTTKWHSFVYLKSYRKFFHIRYLVITLFCISRLPAVPIRENLHCMATGPAARDYHEFVCLL